jgi:hypothetical protein
LLEKGVPAVDAQTDSVFQLRAWVTMVTGEAIVTFQLTIFSEASFTDECTIRKRRQLGISFGQAVICNSNYYVRA